MRTIRAGGIRIAAPDDRPGVEAVLEASYSVLMANAYDAEVLAAALPTMCLAQPGLLASGRYWLAGDPPIGCGGWSLERPGTAEIEPGLGHIRHVAVHPDHVGQGIGRRIFDACRRQAQNCGVLRFACWSSLNAEPYYAALGFAVRERKAIRMGPSIHFPVVCMVLTL